jgi:hypothetical protein
MGLVEKIEETGKARNKLDNQLNGLYRQLNNKIEFVHDNIGKDYRTKDSWFWSEYTVITNVYEDGEFVVINYDYFRYENDSDDLFIKKELLDMSEEEILKNKDTLKAELEAYNQEQLRLLEEFEKEEKLQTKKREYERLQKQLQELESELGK